VRSERAMERKFQGVKWPKNERARDRVGQGANRPESYWPICSEERIGPGAKRLGTDASIAWLLTSAGLRLMRQNSARPWRTEKNEALQILKLQKSRFSPQNSIITKIVKEYDKSSAVAKMGDRLATIDIGWKVGRGCCGGTGSSLGHYLTQCGLGRGLPLYQVASWSIQPFGHICGNAMLLHVGIPLQTIFIRSLVITHQTIYSTGALSYCSTNKIK